MDLRLHIGVHRTATRHLRTALAANRALLAAEGIRVLDPGFAERAFARAIRRHKEGQPLAEVNAELMTTLTGDRDFRRLVIIDPNVSGNLMRPMGTEFFYPRISTTIKRILTVLDGVSLRIFCAVRNPATFIPSAYVGQQRYNPELSFADFVADANLAGLRWSDFLHRVQLKDEQLGITIWRHEDYPFIWRDIAEALTGISNREALVGSTAPRNRGMSLGGALMMHRYLARKPAKDLATFDRIQAVFREKFPSSEGYADPEFWPAELMEELTESYEDDWYYIERMEGVQAITPRRYD